MWLNARITMKFTIRILLLSLWICALVVPSVITLLHQHEKPVIVLNLNEEEKPEQGKTDSDEITMICSSPLMQDLSMRFAINISDIYYPSEHTDHTVEITLPPPENII